MKTSESQTALVGALLKAWKTFPAIKKTKEGQAGNRKFHYAPMDEVLEAVRPVLIENGLLLTQGPDGHSLVTRLDHVSGEWRETIMPVNVEHANMQGYGIELTYRRRYAVQAMLGIVTEDDTDGDTKPPKREEPDKELVQKVKQATSLRDLNTLFKSLTEHQRAPLVSIFTARRGELESV